MLRPRCPPRTPPRAAGEEDVEALCVIHVSSDPEICVLIGAHYYWQVVSGNIQRLDDSLTAIETIMGWTLHGDTRSLPKFKKPDTMKNFNICQTDADVSNQLRYFWEVVPLGLANEDRLSKDDKGVRKNSVECALQNSGRYESESPGRSKRSKIKDNQGAAFMRLKSLQRILRREPEFQKEYDTAISSYCKYFAEKATTYTTREHMTHNVTHRDVVRRRRTTTIGLFRASGSPSLNEVLCTELNPRCFTCC
ncbi:hypothetical protein HPB52_022309 [Rhipicephalus sanguineus]|uniref:Peptidase aspartic putative domain-containing protein n=1 Tax=Rhipicephalus sanguineus TaxID=34632 RepID=A0A9D4Q5S4_RHISA|nr:hypothetical protein HPB52_022309 [Rhipicephalus sanguineus]